MTFSTSSPASSTTSSSAQAGTVPPNKVGTSPAHTSATRAHSVAMDSFPGGEEAASLQAYSAGKAVDKTSKKGKMVLSPGPSNEDFKQFLEQMLRPDSKPALLDTEKNSSSIQNKFVEMVQQKLKTLNSKDPIQEGDTEKVKFSVDLLQIAQNLISEASTQQLQLESIYQGNLIEGTKKKADLWTFVQQKQIEMQGAIGLLNRAQEKHWAELEAGYQKQELEKQAQEFRQKMEMLKLAAEMKQKEWNYLLQLQQMRGEGAKGFGSQTASLPKPPNSTFLHQLAHSGEIGMVQILLEAGLSRDEKDEEGNTPLACAVRAGKLKVAQLLVSANAINRFKNNKQETLLHLALLSHCEEVVQWVYSLDKRSLEARDQDDKTAVCVAVETNQRNMALWLYREGAKLTFRDKEGRTLLHIALDHGSLDLAQWLMGVSPDLLKAKDSEGRYPLTQALRQGLIPLADEMLIKGAPFDPQHRQNQWILPEAAAEGNCELIEWLLKKGVAIDAEDPSECTALLRAILEGQIDAAKLLILRKARTIRPIPGKIEWRGKKFAPETLIHAALFAKQAIDLLDWLISLPSDLEMRHSSGRTVLQLAVENSLLGVAKFLVVQDAHVEVKTAEQESLLHLAVRSGSLEMVQWVYGHMQMRGKIDQVNAEKMTPLKLAIVLDQIKSAQWLHQKNAVPIDASFLFAWARKGSLRDTLEWLLSFLSVDLNYLDIKEEYCQTALQTAVYHQNQRAVALLTSKGASTTRAHLKGESLLHIALESREYVPSFFKWLLSLPGIDIEAINEADCTPLQKAILSGHEQAAVCLAQENANTKVINRQGHTLLHLAVLSQRKESLLYVYSLCKRDLDTLDNRQQTPLQLALNSELYESAAFLTQRGATVASQPEYWLVNAVKKGHKEIVEWLVNWLVGQGVFVKYTSAGESIFYTAVASDQIEIAKFLISKGADTYLSAASFEILFRQVVEHSKDPENMINWLLRLPSITRTKGFRERALFYALQRGREDSAEVLKRKGANREFESEEGQNFIHCAVLSKKLKTVKWAYFFCPAFLNNADKKGNTPLALAKGLEEIEWWLKSKGAK